MLGKFFFFWSNVREILYMKKIGNLYLVFYVLIGKDKDKRQLRMTSENVVMSTCY